MDWNAELLKVYRKHGRIDPDLLVTVAKDEKHPLHNHPTWTWEVQDAAEWAWREQARSILRHTTIRYVDSGGENGETRAFHAVPQGKNRYAWEPAETVATDERMHKLVLREMNRRIKDMRTQYGHLQEYREAITAEARKLIAADG